jgi:hypothetical protein
MIIYGSRSTELVKRNLKEKCANCETPNSIQLQVYQKYAHIFWVPLFPMNKLGISQCTHCRQTLSKEQFPHSLEREYKNVVAETRAPLWTFVGLALIAVFIGMGMVNSQVTDKLNAERIAAPQNGDLYEIKTEGNQYTLYKVEQMDGDSVFVRYNNYETNKRSGLFELDEKGYSELMYGYSKNELNEMLQKGEILEIKRYGAN